MDLLICMDIKNDKKMLRNYISISYYSFQFYSIFTQVFI